MYIAVKELGTAIRRVLDNLNYGKADIQVIAAESVEPSVAGGAGRRGFTIVVNLDTGAYEGFNGSWGGANMFVGNPVDDDHELLTIPPNGAVVKGTRGYPRTYATLYVNPASMRLLESGEPQEQLTDADLQALYCFVSIKGGEYRRDEMRRRNVTDSTVDSLVERGYLKRNRAGATQVTTKGKNASTIRY